MLLAPFVRQGDLVLVTGDRGTGKSTAIMDIICSLILPPHHLVEGPDGSIEQATETLVPHHNGAFAGALTASQDVWNARTAVILDAENDTDEWRMLYEETMLQRGLRPDSFTARMVQQLIRWRDAHNIDFNDLDKFPTWVNTVFIPELLALDCGAIFIDSTHKCWTKDLNNPDWVARGLGYLKYACRKNNITIFSITHTSRDHKDKSDDAKLLPSFTSQQEKEADTILGLARRKKDNQLRIKLVKRRYAKWNQEDTWLTVMMSPTYGGYSRVLHNPWLDERPCKEGEPVLTEAERSLLCKLPPDIPFDMNVIDGTPSYNRKLMEQGLIPQNCAISLGGSGKRGDPYRYRLTELGADFRIECRAAAKKAEKKP